MPVLIWVAVVCHNPFPVHEGDFLACEAYSNRKFPTDAEMKKEERFLIKWGSVLNPDQMLGQSLHVGSCWSSLRNLCRARMRAEHGSDVLARQDAWHNVFTMWNDLFGKGRCNACEVALLIEAHSGGRCMRSVYLFTRARFSPKVGYYVEFDLPSTITDRVADITFPFLVSACECFSRVCPDKKNCRL